MPTFVSTLNEVGRLAFDSSDAPFIINIKTEEDENIKQEEDM